MDKFCCNKFRFLNSGETTMGLNIRIVGLSKAFQEKAQLNIDRNFVMTEGYSGKIEDCVKKVVISFCPFCATDLRAFYRDDGYIQEFLE